jgi:hypothetical protein
MCDALNRSKKRVGLPAANSATNTCVRNNRIVNHEEDPQIPELVDQGKDDSDVEVEGEE